MLVSGNPKFILLGLTQNLTIALVPDLLPLIFHLTVYQHCHYIDLNDNGRSQIITSPGFPMSYPR